jgi:5-methylcytosine-specific restriction endonuclease McrA
MARLTRLGGIAPRLDMAVGFRAPKMVDGFYKSAEWIALRKACLERDKYQCQLVLPGCMGRASIADHKVSRRNGGADNLANLRSVCRACDNRLKEDHLGRRRGGPAGEGVGRKV